MASRQGGRGDAFSAEFGGAHEPAAPQQSGGLLRQRPPIARAWFVSYDRLSGHARNCTMVVGNGYPRSRERFRYRARP